MADRWFKEISLDALEMVAGGQTEANGGQGGGFNILGMAQTSMVENKRARTQKECAVIQGEYGLKQETIRGEYGIKQAHVTGGYQLAGQLAGIMGNMMKA